MKLAKISQLFRLFRYFRLFRFLSSGFDFWINLVFLAVLVPQADRDLCGMLNRQIEIEK